LPDSTNAEILHVVYPERNTEILRFAQDGSERAQNDNAYALSRSPFSRSEGECLLEMNRPDCCLADRMKRIPSKYSGPSYRRGWYN
jgi:hypothetical protein